MSAFNDTTRHTEAERATNEERDTDICRKKRERKRGEREKEREEREKERERNRKRGERKKEREEREKKMRREREKTNPVEAMRKADEMKWNGRSDLQLLRLLPGSKMRRHSVDVCFLGG